MLIVFVIIAVTVMPEHVHAQIDTIQTNEQTTLSENLQDDPLAQEILRKIEHTKNQITKIEQREKLQQEVDEKRSQAFASLQRDLEAWQKLWEEFTFDYAFERKTGIFWDQYNFTKSKIMAGRAALQEVLSEGGNAEQARSAYVEAAKIKRSEIIEANSLFNVNHGFAYYNQQILFDSDGQFHDIVSGDQLRKYYQDFRTTPLYLNSNPNDEISWTDLSADIQAECRNGYVLVHRFQTDDYVCVTEQTSETWVRHGMGKPLIDDIIIPNNDKLTVEKFREDTIKEKVKNINNKISTTYMYYHEKLQDMEEKYGQTFADLEIQQREEEKKIIEEFESTDMSQEKFMQKIEKVRKTYELLEQVILKEKDQAFRIMESNHEQHMKDFVTNFDFISDVKIMWDSDELRYEAVRT